MRGMPFKYVVIMLPLVLMGCSKASTSGIHIEYVDRPVIQVEKCIRKEDIPVRPSSLKSQGLPADLEKALALALAKVSEYTRYSNKTEVIFEGCTR